MTTDELDALEAALAKATPGPWCWEQCGEKCDDPVIGVAWLNNDETYTPIAGQLRDFDNEGNPVEYYRESIAYLGDADSPDASRSNNAVAIVALRNAAPALIAAARVQSEIVAWINAEFDPDSWGDDSLVTTIRDAIANGEWKKP